MPDFAENSLENQKNETAETDFSRSVAGLLFSGDARRVALLLVDAYAETEGFLEAPRTRLDDHETPAEGLQRAFFGLSGLDLADWDSFCLITRPGSVAHWLRRRLRAGESDLWGPGADQRLNWVPIEFLLTNRFRSVSHLDWLLPLALDARVSTCLVYQTPSEK